MDKEQLIEKYIQGRLSDLEKKSVEELIQSDEEFRKAIEWEKQVAASLRQKSEEEFAHLLKELSQKKSTPWLKWAAAAAILILGISAILFLFQPPTPKQLFQSYFEPQPNITQPIIRGSEITTEDYEAFLAYEDRDWANAERLFEMLYGQSSNPVYLLYQGNCLLAMGKFQESIPVLEMAASQNAELSLRAKWFLALAYLQNNNLSKTKSLLQEIIEAEDVYSQQAASLLAELE